MASPAEYDYICPICRDIFKAPVILSCSHSVCKECLEQFWKVKKARECPVCRMLSAHEPTRNLALKNLCESFQKEESESLSRSEETCSLHGETLKLFCLEDKQPACLVCMTSQMHTGHTFRPVGEVASSYKKEFSSSLKALQEELRHKETIKEHFEKTFQHIKDQADHTERRIKQQFGKLHQFLRDEEKNTITALREEEKQKKQVMKEKLEEMNTHISTLSDSIRDTEEMLKASDVCFLKKFRVKMERVQISQPDPQTPSGALIHVSQYLGNLQYRVWRKMQDIVHYSPIILDPNVAHRNLFLSDDLTSLKWSLNSQAFPDNPERFDEYSCVLGSEGFTSGKHCWDVEVKESLYWSVGVTTASNQRKGCVFFNSDVWWVQYGLDDRFGFPIKQKLERVRVELDCDEGIVCFSDSGNNTPLYTFKATFNDTVFPFFWSNDFKILPVLPFYRLIEEL
ncbi:zinc-binding protein A33 [Danio aesculapii]|uniref:zinc-binding protein A33 n=1 Tax=Danio aesculapii TaxID=1142201 RepID=UPI0024BF90C5|nr:zinc-binding protein A33 [Danio aesculapii]